MSISIDDIEKEILAGFPNSRKRLDSALYNLEFYNGDFSRFPTRPPDEDQGPYSRRRTSLLMQRVTNVLTQNLYREGPKRTIAENEQASQWLGAVYQANAADALWQQADRFGVVSQVAAIQAEPSPDPARPVRIRPWDASQFEVWTHPDEPVQPIAVAVLDKYDNQRRARLWTDEEVRVYVTQKLSPGQTTGGTAYRRIDARSNALGMIPFAFAHFNFPACDFWSGGPGDYLRSANDVANCALTDGWDSIRANLLPVLVFENVQPGFAPKKVRPGAIWDLPGRGESIAREASTPKANYLQANPSYIPAGWEDLQNYLDHVLEMLGVPPAAVRMVQDSARSGVSIVAEQIPLITWAESRQRPFGYYEQALAKLVLRVGARVFAGQPNSEYRATAAQLEAAAEAPLSLDWPDMYPRLPGPDTDAADQWELDNGLESRVTVLMRRRGWTRDEAEKHLEQVSKDVKADREVMDVLKPPPIAPGSKPTPTEDPEDEAADDGEEEEA